MLKKYVLLFYILIISLFFQPSLLKAENVVFTNESEEKYIKKFYQSLKTPAQKSIVETYFYQLKKYVKDTFQIYFLKYLPLSDNKDSLIGILGKKFKFDNTAINSIKDKLDYSEYYKTFNNLYLFSFNGFQLYQKKISEYELGKADYISKFEIKDYLNKGSSQIYLENYVFPLSKKDLDQTHRKYLHLYDIEKNSGKFKLIFSHPIYSIKYEKNYNEIVHYNTLFKERKGDVSNTLVLEKIFKKRYYKKKIKGHFESDYTDKIIERVSLYFVYDKENEIMKPTKQTMELGKKISKLIEK